MQRQTAVVTGDSVTVQGVAPTRRGRETGVRRVSKDGDFRLGNSATISGAERRDAQGGSAQTRNTQDGGNARGNKNAQAKNAQSGKNAKSSHNQSSASLMQFFRPVRGKLIAAIALQIVASLFSVMPYIALLWLADAMAVLARPDGHTAWNAVMIYLIAVSVESLIAALGMLLTHIADVDLQARTRIDLADTLGRVPLGWFDANGAGRVRKALNDDVESLHHLIAHSILDIVSAVVTPLVGVVFCFVMDWRMGLIALIPAVLYMATFSLMSPRDNRGVMDQIAASLAAVSEAIVDYVGGVAVLKIFGRAKEGSRRFRKTSNAFISDFARFVGPQMRAQAVALIWLSAPVVALMVALGGVIFVDQGSIEPAKALVVALVALSLPGALITLASGNQAYSEGREAVERITKLLNEPPLPQPSKPLRPANRTVEFDDVHFSYPQVDGAGDVADGADGAEGADNSSLTGDGYANNQNGSGILDGASGNEPKDVSVAVSVRGLSDVASSSAFGSVPRETSHEPTNTADVANEMANVSDSNEAIAGVSFTVPEGGTVALVGPSGAGKSTLALLLARFHDVDAGSIRIGGVDVRQITEPVLRANVGLVLQQVQLPALSLKENIALGRSDASIDDIIAAAKAAHIHERIMALPRGYDSVIGDDALLSGGEAQRVSIARVILQNTPILIMDEATSAADPEIETEIQSALSDLVVGRTVVIIAHRLQTVQHADNILVIDHGRIIQSGTHAQLANVPRAYADMWQAQQSDKGAQASAASSAETSIAASAASATDAANATTAISKEDRS